MKGQRAGLGSKSNKNMKYNYMLAYMQYSSEKLESSSLLRIQMTPITQHIGQRTRALVAEVIKSMGNMETGSLDRK